MLIISLCISEQLFYLSQLGTGFLRWCTLGHVKLQLGKTVNKTIYDFLISVLQFLISKISLIVLISFYFYGTMNLVYILCKLSHFITLLNYINCKGVNNNRQSMQGDENTNNPLLVFHVFLQKLNATMAQYIFKIKKCTYIIY